MVLPKDVGMQACVNGQSYFPLVKDRHHGGSFPSHALAVSGMQDTPGCPDSAHHAYSTALPKTGGWQAHSIRHVYSYGERACKSFFHLPCGRALFSHSLLGCPLEPNPFVRAPQQETSGASNMCQTFYSYSNRGLEREMLSSESCTGNSAWTRF